MERSYLQVKVHPAARVVQVQVRGPGQYEVSVKVPAERGLANAACLETLAGFLGCRPSQLRIVKGTSSPHKIIERIG
ncbi:MAG: DUF167 domain-containing protein [Coprothermobacterota bacterium]|nr:DUF167 domain-containing protein [Coprothermobacterota bacterium]